MDTNGWLTQSKNMEKSFRKFLFPVLFLDIDGVLNSSIYFEKRKLKLESDKSSSSFTARDTLNSEKKDLPWDQDLDPLSIENLNCIVRDVPNLEIILSSTWRRSFLPDQMTELMKLRGFVGEITHSTSVHNGKYDVRGNEIKHWLECNRPLGFFRYIILDDDSDMLYEQRNNFLHIDSYAGLTPNHAYKAVRFLNGETNHL